VLQVKAEMALTLMLIGHLLLVLAKMDIIAAVVAVRRKVDLLGLVLVVA
jgi:hypothetical protein